jgi:hypothetical protein
MAFACGSKVLDVLFVTDFSPYGRKIGNKRKMVSTALPKAETDFRTQLLDSCQ